MKRVLTCLQLVFIFISGCGGIDIPDLDALYARQPRVVSVEPTDGAEIIPDAKVAIGFSQQIDPASVDPSTLAVIRSEDGQDNDDVQAIVKGEAQGIDGVYEFAGEGRVATFRPREPYEAGATYKVVATSGIMSVEMLPLVQRPGSVQSAFVSTFSVRGDASANMTGDGGGEGGTGVGGGGGSTGGSSSTAPKVRPSSLVINELFYDVPGEDTNGQLFIELFGTAGTEIDGYKVVFITGDTGVATETISIPKGAVIPADGIFLIADSMTGQSGVSHIAGADFIDNFDPHNGPDGVQLQDDKGNLVDALGYGTPIKAPAANGLVCFEGNPASKVTAGSSLSRTGGTDTGNNATDFHALTSPTPGAL